MDPDRAITNPKGQKPRITTEQKRELFFLVLDPEGPQMTTAGAAKRVGMSRDSAHRYLKGWKGHNAGEDARRREADLPDPKQYDELSDEAKRALADFNYFRVRYFARRTDPGGLLLAKAIVDALEDPERVFLDANFFPGAGKTTIMHDIEAWLLAGGGKEDPRWGRALRFMLGSETKTVARHMGSRLRRSLELRRPYWDKEQRVYAEAVLSIDFGRFKPEASMGEESLWRQEEFIVAQLDDVDLYEKEPTVQIASQESGFLGERVDLAVWDDLATVKNSKTPDQQKDLSGWFEDEAETRIEPGGVLVLVGQRLGPYDLHRARQDATYTDEAGEARPLYRHFTLPAHLDHLCTGEHSQWDGDTTGCLTNSWRFSGRDFMRLKEKTNFQTVYQQADTDPGKVLVQEAWLIGGEDSDGYPAPGCYNRERGFKEWPDPALTGPLVNYCTVDPSAGNWWAIEWWAISTETKRRYLIYGERKALAAGKFLDWDHDKGVFVGIMHELTVESYLLGQPLRVWVVEQNAAHKYLFQFQHYFRWRRLFPDTFVIPHQTQANRNDPDLGVEAALPSLYRQGMKDLPKKQGDVDALNYMRVKERELTTYVTGMWTKQRRQGFDTVMTDWIGEWNIDRILELARKPMFQRREIMPDAKLPPYLLKQAQQVNYG